LKEELQLDDKPLIGNCSALAPHKDYFTFLKVAKKAPYANFVIMGSGPLEDELKKFTKDHEINNVIFTGFLDDINHKLHSLDLLLFTSSTEGLGTSLLDAMLCEVPIVATNVGGIPEIVKNNQTGLLCEKGDVDALEKSCAQILNDPELRQRIVSNAKELASNDFSDEQTANKTYAVYNDVLSQLTT
jgi:glycosyltransferase involved in cell wall biosynthesis